MRVPGEEDTNAWQKVNNFRKLAIDSPNLKIQRRGTPQILADHWPTRGGQAYTGRVTQEHGHRYTKSLDFGTKKSEDTGLSGTRSQYYTAVSDKYNLSTQKILYDTWVPIGISHWAERNYDIADQWFFGTW